MSQFLRHQSLSQRLARNRSLYPVTVIFATVPTLNALDGSPTLAPNIRPHACEADQHYGGYVPALLLDSSNSRAFMRSAHPKPSVKLASRSRSAATAWSRAPDGDNRTRLIAARSSNRRPPWRRAISSANWIAARACAGLPG